MVVKHCQECGAELSNEAESGTLGGKPAEGDAAKITAPPVSQAVTVLAQIEQLATLHDHGRVTDEEYKTAKKVLLSLAIDVEGQMKRLGALLDQKIINKSEFEKKTRDLASLM